MISRSMLVLAIGAVMIGIGSCRKKEDTIAKIYVLDQNNNRVAGATVELIGEGTNGTVRDPKTATTNEQGEATFNYNDIYQLGQCGVAIFKIKASLGGAVANGIIKVEQEETTEETVFI
ncbi:Ig-like domain-containing protein [Fluviicola chungangensis]|uniref:Carboxypeptidase regulatory-like domain-containing protein n=1 Tax=Fluviicola chungangensis TaxID=2597671 RepID=A0A556N311_9FLAO|nr:Ig-like domain-containing protein [Fluviicola chungangensis]TSJ46587.1 carboxypeptidase regulatory-like domain-containing protein [Fluviicola chungangensis]